MSNAPIGQGIYDMPSEAYFAHPALSQSGAKLLLEAPAKYKWHQEHGSAPTKAMNLGSAAHSLLLGVGAEVVTVPEELLSADGGVRTKAAREWKSAAESRGCIVLGAADYDAAHAMVAEVRKHPEADRLLQRGKPEQSLFTTIDGVPVKGRVDWVADTDEGPMLADYKTADDASPDGFERAVGRYGYHIQAAWYQALYKQITGDWAPFRFIVQEKQPPYLVAVYELDGVAERVGALEMGRAISRYKQCVELEEWRGYPEKLQYVSLPTWLVPDLDLELI